MVPKQADATKLKNSWSWSLFEALVNYGPLYEVSVN